MINKNIIIIILFHITTHWHKMKNKKYGNTMALKEHLLHGHKVSRLESLLLFGVNQLDTVIKELKRDGFIIKKENVPMAKLIKRINKAIVEYRRNK